jgi:hypothetical protein
MLAKKYPDILINVAEGSFPFSAKNSPVNPADGAAHRYIHIFPPYRTRHYFCRLKIQKHIVMSAYNEEANIVLVTNQLISIIAVKKQQSISWKPVGFKQRRSSKSLVNVKSIVNIGIRAWKDFNRVKKNNIILQ